MAQITILNQANVPQGPFNREQVAHKLAAGEFTLDSLAHVEGLAQWTPLRAVLAKVDAAMAPPPPAVPPIPGGSNAPPLPTPAYSYAATMQPPSHLVYAGFWIRLVAYLVDGVIIGVVMTIVISLVGLAFFLVGALLGANLDHNMVGFDGMGNNGQRYAGNMNAPNAVAIILLLLMELTIWAIALGGTWLYFAKLESGPNQATFGKRLLGLRVTDLEGKRIGFGRATGRFFGKIVSALPFELGFVMAAFTERKQALHDMIAGTLVIKG